MTRKIIFLALLFLIITSVLWGQKKVVDKSYMQIEASSVNQHRIVPYQISSFDLDDNTLCQQLKLVQVKIHLKQKSFDRTLISVEQSPKPIQFFSENFESTFPGFWRSDSMDFSSYFWAPIDKRYKSYRHSAWCAAGGQKSLPYPMCYPDNCNSWLVYGPVYLANVNWAVVRFWVWLSSELERDYLFWVASTDGQNFYGNGMSGDTNGWKEIMFNLTDVYELGDITGKPEVWITFVFYSNESNTMEGAYLDDIVFESARSDTAEQFQVKIDTVLVPDFPCIDTYLSVTKNNKFIINLSGENFVVLENGYKQDIIKIIPTNIKQTISTALVMDNSTSLSEKDRSSIDTAACHFVKLMGPNDQGAIFKFAAEVKRYQKLTPDKELLRHAIKDSIYKGADGTALFDAVDSALIEVRLEKEPKCVIAITDGKEKSSRKVKHLDTLINNAIKSNILIFTIGIGSYISEDTLNYLANCTGGIYYYAHEATQLDSICKNIFQELAREYKVSFLTRRPIHDGSTRNVTIYANYDNDFAYDMLPYTSPAADTIKLGMDRFICNFGDTPLVPINIKDATHANIYSIFLVISYDKHVVMAIDTVPGIIPSSWTKSVRIDTSNGKIWLAAAGDTALYGSGSLMDVIFNIIGNPGDTTTLHFEKILLNEGYPDAETTDGIIKIVGEGFNLSGTIGYYPKLDSYSTTHFDSLFKTKKDFDALFKDSVLKFIDSVKIDLKNAKSYSKITDSFGFYQFHNLPRGFLESSLNKKDNLNDAITPYDASLILQYVIGLRPFSPYQMIAADVTGDGSISALDASYILRMCTGDTNKFIVRADWAFVPHDSIINSINWHRISRFRSYHPLDKSLDNQNFFGIVYGDVSGNWQPPKEPLAKNECDDLISHLVIDTPIEFSENKANLTISFMDVSDIYSFSLSLKYDPRILKVMNARTTEQTQNYILVFNTENDHINISAAGPEAMNWNCSIVNIEFELSEVASSNSSNIWVTEFALNEVQVKNLYKEISLNIASAIPTEYRLAQNYPNPLNMWTIIKYQLPAKTHVKIEVFNLLGQRVRTLVNEEIKAGYHLVNWDGKDDFQTTVASGVYICRFQANRFVSNRKMVVLK